MVVDDQLDGVTNDESWFQDLLRASIIPISPDSTLLVAVFLENIDLIFAYWKDFDTEEYAMIVNGSLRA